MFPPFLKKTKNSKKNKKKIALMHLLFYFHRSLSFKVSIVETSNGYI